MREVGDRIVTNDRAYKPGVTGTITKLVPGGVSVLWDDGTWSPCETRQTLDEYTTGVALVPYRAPEEIRKGDIVRIRDMGLPLSPLVAGIVYQICYNPSDRRRGALERIA